MADEQEETKFEREYNAYLAKKEAALTEIDALYPKQRALGICESFAEEHDIEFVLNGECGFGRPCVGFSKHGRWIQYDPMNWSRINSSTDLEDCYILRSGNVGAPEYVEAYHKSDLLCVLKTDCDTNLVRHIATMSSALQGDVEGVEKAQAIPEAEVPDASTERALAQAALWVETLEQRGRVKIVEFDTGATGLQALLDGGTTAHAIVVEGD